MLLVASDGWYMLISTISSFALAWVPSRLSCYRLLLASTKASNNYVAVVVAVVAVVVVVLVCILEFPDVLPWPIATTDTTPTAVSFPCFLSQLLKSHKLLKSHTTPKVP